MVSPPPPLKGKGCRCLEGGGGWVIDILVFVRGDRNGRFITSNTNITLENSTSVPIGERYVKFVTKQ
jgi:hypothetical protein